ncbi:MAG: hypothetical protein JW984_03230 [Deltaproteobacteria bacterium]|uniref:Uncharacterized protein n=1 Tax=Candidatus Zymogenus saltonus TaxID=2844893 RepID=A0A9D8PNK9_9DELT|nr:hypothetical protein [Candidatus Zymogenus saltonus]
MKDVKNKDGALYKDSLLREFLQKQFDFCWENQKINYETREKLLRIYIPVLSILPASLIILYKLQMNDNSLLLFFALTIICIFSFLTWIRYLSLRLSITRYRKYINFLSKKLLKMENLEDSEYKEILNNIPSKDIEEPKSLNKRSGDYWLILSFGFITALTLSFWTYILLDNLDLLKCILRDNLYYIPIGVFLVCFIILYFWMTRYFSKHQNEE